MRNFSSIAAPLHALSFMFHNSICSDVFLSKKLYPAEQNYDAGDQELLANKVAFEEWRH